jgi:hypothetical protein
MRRLLIGLALVVALAGCARLPPLPADCVTLGPAGAICPLPPSALPAVSARHVVTVRQGKEAHTFLGRLRIDPEALRLAGASLFGTHLFTITWDGKNIVSAPPEPTMHPKLVVAMLQVALADPDRLRPRLHGLVLDVAHHGDREIRQLHERGRLVARIERRGVPLDRAHLTITIPPANLHLDLKPLPASHGTD